MRIERHGSVALLRLESGKVNAIGPDFIRAFNGLLDQLGDASAAVITGRGNTFSAGLDLPTLVALDGRAMNEFIGEFNQMMLRTFELHIPVVAAVNGHAIAGGCVLAMQADIRIAADRDARIGLNETQLGIGLPTVILETMRCQVPGSSLGPIALEGKLFSPRDALALGILHDVVPENDLLDKALARAQALAALPPAGVRQVKAAIRKPVADHCRQFGADQDARWVAGWVESSQGGVLQATVAKLKQR